MDNLWDTVVKTAQTILPAGIGFLTNAILPGTGAGGMAADLIAGILGVEPTPQAIEAGLRTATSEQIQQITAEANRHKESLRRIAFKNEEIRLQDVQSARQRQTASEKATGKRDINIYILSYVVVVGFFGLVGFLMFQDLPEANIGPINQLFGSIATGFGIVLNYFFGSSKSSADKNKIISAKK